MSQEKINFWTLLAILLVLAGDMIALFLELNNQQRRQEEEKQQSQSAAKIKAEIQELHNEITSLKLAIKKMG